MILVPPVKSTPKFAPVVARKIPPITNNNTDNKLESCYCFVDDDKNDFLEDMFPLGIFHEIASFYIF